MKKLSKIMLSAVFLISTSAYAKETASSIKDSADKSGSANKGAMYTQILMGGAMAYMSYKQYAPCSSGNGGSCALMALYAGMSLMSFQQAKNHQGAANTAYKTSFDTDGLNGMTGEFADLSTKGQGELATATKNMDKLQDLGIYNSKTGMITTPDGKSYKGSDFSSAGSMAGAGFPKGAILAAMDAYSKVGTKASDKASKYNFARTEDNGGFAGGGGGGSSVSYVDEESDGQHSAGMNGAGKESLLGARDPANLAGMQKNYNGEPIGVSADSIFLMMNRRYKVKENQDSFYDEFEISGKTNRSSVKGP